TCSATLTPPFSAEDMGEFFSSNEPTDQSTHCTASTPRGCDRTLQSRPPTVSGASVSIQSRKGIPMTDLQTPGSTISRRAAIGTLGALGLGAVASAAQS